MVDDVIQEIVKVLVLLASIEKMKPEDPMSKTFEAITSTLAVTQIIQPLTQTLINTINQLSSSLSVIDGLDDRLSNIENTLNELKQYIEG